MKKTQDEFDLLVKQDKLYELKEKLRKEKKKRKFPMLRKIVKGLQDFNNKFK